MLAQAQVTAVFPGEDLGVANPLGYRDSAGVWRSAVVPEVDDEGSPRDSSTTHRLVGTRCKASSRRSVPPSWSCTTSGRGRPVAPQAGCPRLPRAARARVRIHAAPGAGLRRPCVAWAFAPRAGTAPGVAGLAGVETEPRQGIRLHTLAARGPGVDRDPGHGLAQVAGHRHLRRGDLHPGGGGLTQALDAEGLLELADQRTTAALRQALLSADRDRIAALADDGQLPLLLATSDNGAQMRSRSTREFLAGFAITQRFGRPSTPTDQAWIESLFGHVMGEWPHLERIRDSGELDRELDRVRVEYNPVRLHAGIGYVPPSTNTKTAATPSAKPDATDSTGHAKPASVPRGQEVCVMPPRQPSAAWRQEATGAAAGTVPVEVSATGVLDRPGTDVVGHRLVLLDDLVDNLYPAPRTG